MLSLVWGHTVILYLSVHKFPAEPVLLYFTVSPAVTHPDCKYMLFTSSLSMHVLWIAVPASFNIGKTALTTLTTLLLCCLKMSCDLMLARAI